MKNDKFINPKHGFPIEVKRLFTDVGGEIIDKNTLPAELKTKTPFYLFGAYDFNGGFFLANSQNAPVGGWFYSFSFIQGVNLTPLFGIGLNQIRQFIKNGDLVHVLTDNLDAPTYFCFTIIHANNAGYGGLLADCYVKPLLINSFNYQPETLDQYNEQLLFIFNDKLGRIKTQSVEPRIYLSSMNYQDLLLFMPVKMEVNTHISMCSYLQFQNDTIIFNFNYSKNGYDR